MEPHMKSGVLVLSTLLLAACRGEAPDPVVPEVSPAATAAAPTATSSVFAPAASAALVKPSFDCAAASRDTEKLVCTDPVLAALDLQLDAQFKAAMAANGADTKALAATQRGWLKGRDDCWKSGDMPRCILESYKTQLVRLQLDSGKVMVPTPVEYVCDDKSKPLTAVFYNELDPKAAVITLGSDQAIAFPQPAASGARYGREGLDFWEHQGDVQLDFWGIKRVCKPAGGKPGGA
jgi:uncharacterized protein